MIMDALRQWLSPWYLEIKFVHLAAVMALLWSTSVAYVHYLLPAFRAWRRHPDDEGVIALWAWVMDRFDRGALIEPIAFSLVMISGRSDDRRVGKECVSPCSSLWPTSP